MDNTIDTNNLFVGDLSIKVTQKLAQVNACPGAEGTAYFYCCELYTPDKKLVTETFICIFIARYEEFATKLVASKPEKYANAEEAINDLLSIVEKEYIAYSMREKAWYQGQLH